ncbi:hypothetical protein QQS21_000019 [Conoideocrella luteorostrata]|uniref:Uncharacterized protein n=1 Tax=Conoideocrella luteorostrata TaxID=1105319 RepID=A0AAJ0D1D6_9HYPO|nr:hypothetical protein QQS21_000019 [Conoideocrella luteorostrata]
MLLISALLLATIILAKGQNADVTENRKLYREPENFDVVETKKKAIEERFSIDETRPPFLDVTVDTEWPCWKDLSLFVLDGCMRATHISRLALNPYTARTSAWYNIYIESESTSGSNPVYMAVSKSHSTTTALSQGWSLGVHTTINPLGYIGGSVTSEINQQTTHSNTWTSEITNTYVCPAWHHCQIQTWTWHVTFQGACENEPLIDCGRIIRPCKEKDLCPSFWTFARPGCFLPAVPCNVTLPLFKGPGAPYSEVKFREYDIRAQYTGCSGTNATLSTGEIYDPKTKLYSIGEQWYPKPRNSPPPALPSPYPCVASDTLSGPPRIPKVVDKLDGWCVLDDGDLYAADTDEYFNSKEWYSRAGVPKPDTTGYEPCLKNSSK